jgi:hypothetical protein
MPALPELPPRYGSIQWIAWFTSVGIYLAVMGLLLLAGVALVLWGLFGDRSRGRARCPRCWYDLRGRREGKEGLICPECGHDARTERSLYRNRRRWPAICMGTALALPSAYMLSIAAGYYWEQRAIARIDARLEGYARYKGVGVSEYPSWPDWLRQRLPGGLGVLSDRARNAGLSWSTVTDLDLQDCRRLTSLEELELAGAQVTDAGMCHLRPLHQLTTLDLNFTAVTDQALIQIGRMHSLQVLRLRRTGVTDDGLRHLRGLDRLHFLELTQSGVTERGLVHLQGLKRLGWLMLSTDDPVQAEAAVAELKQFLPEIKVQVHKRP